MSGTSEAPVQTRELLRLCTCGSVDDGKSTLIGRLLVDAKAVLSDQLEHVRAATERRGGEGLDLALLTDGLRAEREQGITIDVAHRYFATPRRSFVLADCPGHERYTRNMVTGASTSQAAIVMIDARHGVVEQTRRHLGVLKLLGVAHRIVCVNKMDLVDWSRARFDAVCSDVLGVDGAVEAFIPTSALDGDGVTFAPPEAPWYDGPPLLELLEELDVDAEPDAAGTRLPVQWVTRDGDERWLCGRQAGGVLRAGDDVIVAPGGEAATVVEVATFDGPLAESRAPRSIRVRLDRDVDVSRGDVLCGARDAPEPVRELDATLCWMSEAPLRQGTRYALKHAATWVRAAVDAVEADGDTLELNDLGRVRLRTSAPLALDAYADNRVTGSFLLVDESTNETVAAGMVDA